MQPMFRLHLQEIIDFLDSVVIKFDPFVELFNNKIEYIRSDFDINDKTTYPYYRILAGDESFASTPIYCWVPSLQSEILLTRSAVISHPDMFNFYQDKSQLNMLLNRYPNDKFLIKRILNPVADIASAIESSNLSMLTLSVVDTSIPDYERYDLVNFLIDFLSRFEYRWYINTFNYEDLHPYAFWSMMWNLLPLILVVKRILNIRTNTVHSYYIWEYLTSVGFGSYRSYLSRKQELFLYRNNEYIKFNVGKKFMLDILSSIFLTPIKYSLSEKMVVAHTTDCQEDHTKLPEIVPRLEKKPEYQSSTNFDYFLTSLVDNNLDCVDTSDHREDVVGSFTKAPTNELMTKFIELVRNISGTELMLLIRFILDSVAYLLSVGKLNTNIMFTSPIGGTTINFDSVTDILNLFYYCIYKKNGEIPVNIIQYYTSVSAIVHESPPVVAEHVFRDNYQFITQSYFDSIGTSASAPYIVGIITSPIELSSKLGEQYQWLFEQLSIIRDISDHTTYLSAMATYRAIVPELTVLQIPQTFTTYEDYFEHYPDAQVLLSNITSDDDYIEVISSIFEAICPLVYGFQSIADDRDAAAVLIFKIKEVFTYLTSYNVAFFTAESGSVDELTIPLLVGSCDLISSDISTPISDWGRNWADYELSIVPTSYSFIDTDVNTIVDMEYTANYDEIELSSGDTDVDTVTTHSDTIFLDSYGSQAELSDSL